MRNMSFAMTTEQIRNQTKTVTRRFGWCFLKPGDLVQPVEKGMGLKKGENVKKIGPPIRILHVDRITADQVWPDDCAREGFPYMSPENFITMLCLANNRNPSDTLTRIEFKYTNAQISGGTPGGE